VGEGAQEGGDDHLAEHHDVASEPHQNVAETLTPVKTERKGLQVAKKLPPQRHDDVLPGRGRPDVLQVVEMAAERGQSDDRRDGAEEEAERVALHVLERDSKEPHPLVEQDAIEQELKGPGLEKGDERVANRRQAGEQESRRVGL
jgi:hypothetical protein